MLIQRSITRSLAIDCLYPTQHYPFLIPTTGVAGPH